MTHLTEEQAKGLKAGDVVLIPAKVLEEVGDETLTLWLETGARVSFLRGDVHSIPPRPLEVGDRVQLTEVSEPDAGSIKAIEGKYVWVVWDVEAPSTCLMSELERLP